MYKEANTDFQNAWFDLWVKQSQKFFSSNHHDLKDYFNPQSKFNPHDYLQQIQHWMEDLKQHLQFSELIENHQAYSAYYRRMTSMCTDAADLMYEQWLTRTQENNPIKTPQDLYQLWLSACQEVYGQAMHSKSYQELYGEMMNATLQFWKMAKPT